MQILRPHTEKELATIIQDAKHARVHLEVAGTASKRDVGRPIEAEYVVSSANMSGITMYEPGERVISAKAGTPLAFIEDTLAQNRQMLAFEPVCLATALGKSKVTKTIGGQLASHLCGSRRLLQGSAKDHFLGMRAVNGLGKTIKAGGRVMKNVTGYNLCRSVAGSWGTLAFLTEVTLRVMPKPEQTQTLVVTGLLDVLAIEMMNKAIATPYEVSGAVHMQAEMVKALNLENLPTSDKAITAIRIENFEFAVAKRIDKLKTVLGSFGDIHILDHETSLSFWDAVNSLKFFHNNTAPFWRIVAPPHKGADIINAIKAHHPESLAVYDWGGGLIWLLTPFRADAGASEVHRVASSRGGNAALIRGDRALREKTYVFQPLDNNIKKLMKKMKAAFDPVGILNPGRMYSDL